MTPIAHTHVNRSCMDTNSYNEDNVEQDERIDMIWFSFSQLSVIREWIFFWIASINAHTNTQTHKHIIIKSVQAFCTNVNNAHTLHSHSCNMLYVDGPAKCRVICHVTQVFPLPMVFMAVFPASLIKFSEKYGVIQSFFSTNVHCFKPVLMKQNTPNRITSQLSVDILFIVRICWNHTHTHTQLINQRKEELKEVVRTSVYICTRHSISTTIGELSNHLTEIG